MWKVDLRQHITYAGFDEYVPPDSPLILLSTQICLTHEPHKCWGKGEGEGKAKEKHLCSWWITNTKCMIVNMWCDQANESEVGKYDFWFFGIFY